jgi:ribose-phosphate pyrophosphokinase
MVIKDFDIVAQENDQFACTFARETNRMFHKIRLDHFADTETHLAGMNKLELAGKNILFILHLTSLHNDCVVRVNDNLVNVLLAAHFLKEMGVKKIFLFIPYLFYSRQDKETIDGLVPVLACIGNLFKNASIDALITCDIHSARTAALLPLSFYSIGLEFFWGTLIQKQIIPNYSSLYDYCIAAPDIGGRVRAEKIAALLDLPFISILKQRIEDGHSEVITLQGNVSGKIVIIIDDILDTGWTAVNAAQLLHAQGARDVVGCFTHAVLTEGSCERLEASLLEKIYLSDTVLLDVSKLSPKFFVASLDTFLTQALDQLLKKIL